MYRVELKVNGGQSVPAWDVINEFLMYRVELKDGKGFFWTVGILVSKFLMYRVELKVRQIAILGSLHPLVPNVPCGVESFFLHINLLKP